MKINYCHQIGDWNYFSINVKQNGSDKTKLFKTKFGTSEEVKQVFEILLTTVNMIECDVNYDLSRNYFYVEISLNDEYETSYTLSIRTNSRNTIDGIWISSLSDLNYEMRDKNYIQEYCGKDIVDAIYTLIKFLGRTKSNYYIKKS